MQSFWPLDKGRGNILKIVTFKKASLTPKIKSLKFLLNVEKPVTSRYAGSRRS
jgi:hypothetical protein